MHTFLFQEKKILYFWLCTHAEWADQSVPRFRFHSFFCRRLPPATKLHTCYVGLRIIIVIIIITIFIYDLVISIFVIATARTCSDVPEKAHPIIFNQPDVD